MQDKNFNEHNTLNDEELDREATFISLIKDICKLYCEEKRRSIQITNPPSLRMRKKNT